MERTPLELAQAHGLLTPQQIERWRREAATEPRGEAVVDALHRAGYLDAAEAELLRGYVRRESAAPAGSDGAGTVVRAAPQPLPAGPADPRTVVPQPPTDLTAEQHAAPTRGPGGGADPGPEAPRLPAQIGKYRVEGELGRGGMGVVYRAIHPDLGTPCAVKVLLTGDFTSPEAEDRFRREAQVSARIKHPGVVGVYDFGVETGRTFLVMEYVDGVNLCRVLESPEAYGLTPSMRATEGRAALAPADALRLLREIALAVHAAHEAGVIHRDLKPANVLRQKDGALKVTDFGLAKSLGAEARGMTESGALLGTPEYMSPEQAEGRIREVDACSDVYQLGAILYEMLTGRPPHSGRTIMEVLRSIARQDPPAPRGRNVRVDRDAETICLKALARERSERYPSARALAEDCGRYCSGEAILARPESRAARLARWLRRHKGWSALAGAATLLVAFAGVSAAQKNAAEREAAMQREARARLLEETIGALRVTAETQIEASLVARRAGGSLESARRQFLPRLEAAAAAVRNHAPALAEPYYHLGRLHRALRNDRDALQALEAAIERDPGFAPSRVERTFLLVNAYSSRLERLRETWTRHESSRLAEQGGLDSAEGVHLPALPRNAELTRGDPEATRILALLNEDLAAITASPAPGTVPLPESSVDCVRGLHLALTDRDEEARKEARHLLERAVREDPMLGEAAAVLGDLLQRDGDFAGAVAVLERALEVDRGSVSLLVWLGKARTRWAVERMLAGEDPTEQFSGAEAAYADARRQAQDWLWIAELRGRLLFQWGYHRMLRGEDFAPLFERAGSEFQQAIDGAEDPVPTRLARARMWSTWGNHLAQRGGEGEPWYGRAESDLSAAIERQPSFAEAWKDLAGVRQNRGNAQAQRGLDPLPAYEAAAAAYDTALSLNSRSASVWARRGSLRMNLALVRSSRGKPVGDGMLQAEADYDQAIELAPQTAEYWHGRGQVRLNLGFVQTKGPGDAGVRFEQAEADFTRALAIAPGLVAAWLARGMARSNLAVWQEGRNENPDAAYLGAESDYGKALALNPRSADVWMKRAVVRVNFALTRAGRGEDPGEGFRLADADLVQALDLAPKSAEAWMRRGYVRQKQGAIHAAGGTDPRPDWIQADEHFSRALELNPSLLDARIRRGDVRMLQERWSEAIADFEAAVRLNPALEPRIRDKVVEAKRRRDEPGAPR